MRLHGRIGRATIAAVVLLCSGTALVGIDNAGAQEADAPALYVRNVDSSNPDATSVDFVYSGSPADAKAAVFTENGNAVSPASLGAMPGTAPVNVALIFDTSEAADTSGTLVNAKEAAKDLIAGRTAEQATSMKFAVFLASSTGELIQGYTNSAERLNAAIDRVGPSSDPEAAKDTALWSAIRQAGDTLNGQRGQANILVMTAQADNASGGDAAAAKGAVVSSASSVFAVAFTGTGMDPSSLESLVKTNGGQVSTTKDGTEVGTLVDAVGSTISDGQYRLVYDSSVDVGKVSTMEIQIGDNADTASAVVGGVTVGVPSLHQTGASSASGVGALQSNLFLYLGVLLILVAVSGVVYALFLVFSKDDSLTRQLQPYSEYGAVEADDDDGDQNLATSAIMQRAVDITTQVASDRGVLVRAEHALERANLPLRAGEFIFFYLAGVVVFTLLMLVLTRSLIVTLIMAAIAAMIPITVVNFIAKRRKKQFLALLPDTLSLLSGTLRAGYSLMQGVEAVSQEVQEPMGQELRRVVTEARLGRPLEESLEGVAERMDSQDFAWAVMAIRIQREVGGNLSELLLTVAATMTARERLRRDVATLTAEGRMSAIVLGLLPIGLGAVMYLMNGEYMGQLLNTTLGNIMLGVAFLAMGIGFFWMKKIIDIEI